MLFEITHYKCSRAKIVFCEKVQNSFKCDICDKHFSQKCLLRKHISRVHEEKKSFKSAICDASYGSKQTFNKHMKSKHAEKILKRREFDLEFGTTN